MKTNDLKEVRRLLRVATSASWEIEHLHRVIHKFIAVDDDEQIHVNEEDAMSVEHLEEEMKEMARIIMCILHEDLPRALGINIDDDEIGERSMIDAYKDYQAELVLESAKWRRSRAAA